MSEISGEIKEYLKNNLRINVNVQYGTGYYGKGTDSIEVSLFLENEVISSDSFSVPSE